MSHVMHRTLTGMSVGLGVIALFLWCPLWAVGGIVLVLSCLAQLEFYQLAKRYEPVTWFGLLAGGGIDRIDHARVLLCAVSVFAFPEGHRPRCRAGCAAYRTLHPVRAHRDGEVLGHGRVRVRHGVREAQDVSVDFAQEVMGGVVRLDALLGGDGVRVSRHRAPPWVGLGRERMELADVSACGSCRGVARPARHGGGPDRVPFQARVRREGLRHVHAGGHGRLPRHVRFYTLHSGPCLFSPLLLQLSGLTFDSDSRAPLYRIRQKMLQYRPQTGK